MDARETLKIIIEKKDEFNELLQTIMGVKSYSKKHKVDVEKLMLNIALKFGKYHFNTLDKIVNNKKGAKLYFICDNDTILEIDVAVNHKKQNFEITPKTYVNIVEQGNNAIKH
jgi:hypothetical protein